MSSVSEIIVREYFETCGFFVLQPHKYAATSRGKRAEEEIDLLVVKPDPAEQVLPASLVWTSRELRGVRRAVVSVKGWHTERFSPVTLEMAPELFRFASPEALKFAGRLLGEGPVARVLCLPALSKSPPLRKKTLEILRAQGVDGVLLFPTMLRELASAVEVTRNYDKSDLLQALRILKNYDFLRDEQMELFRRKRRGKASGDDPEPA